MKQQDREEVADIVMQSMIKAGIVKPPKAKPIIQAAPEPEKEKGKFFSEKTGSIKSKFFGKKKPPSYSQLKFNDFMKTECKKGCYLCDDCEGKIREIIKNAIEKDE